MIPRDAVFTEPRQISNFGAPDDFRSIVTRRLVALQYMMNDQGAVVDSSGNIIVDAEDTSNTGVSPAELVGMGYTPDQVAQLAGSVAPNVSGSAGAARVSSGGTATGSASTSGTATGSASTSWISGLSGLFGSLGTTLTNVTRAATNSKINPATGVPYGIDPKTGKPIASSTTQTSLLLIVLVLAIAWALLSGKIKA